jgi:hypothetical protein
VFPLRRDGESPIVRRVVALDDFWRTPIGEGRMDPLRRTLVWLAIALTVAGAAGLAFIGKQNHDRAEGWRQRAIAAEEVVSGQRIVIGQRSQALNLRTTQVNRLAAKLRGARTALDRSEGDVSSLARRQRELANEKARVEDQRRLLETQSAALVNVASGFIDCSDGLFDVLDAVLDEDWDWVSIYGRDRIGSCSDANASLQSYRERFE